jgi:hypothetical protein
VLTFAPDGNASIHGHARLDCVKKLVELKAQVNGGEKNEYAAPALEGAAKENHVEILAYLLDAHAGKQAHFAYVRLRLSLQVPSTTAGVTSLRSRDKLFGLLVIRACVSVCPVLFYLLPSFSRAVGRLEAIHAAAESGSLEALSLLLQRTGKACLNAVAEHGLTPLAIAAVQGHVSCVKLLRPSCTCCRSSFLSFFTGWSCTQTSSCCCLVRCPPARSAAPPTTNHACACMQ